MPAFDDDLLKALRDYDRSVNESEAVKNARKAYQDEEYRRQISSGLTKSLGLIGAATILNGWEMGPVGGVAGTVLGGSLAGLMGYFDYKDARAHEEERSDLLDALREAGVNQWENYKNDSIKKYTGKTAGDWAREGLMIDDNGNLNYIDYDYYSTLPYAKLKEIFGDGADYVRSMGSK